MIDDGEYIGNSCLRALKVDCVSNGETVVYIVTRQTGTYSYVERLGAPLDDDEHFYPDSNIFKGIDPKFTKYHIKLAFTDKEVFEFSLY